MLDKNILIKIKKRTLQPIAGIFWHQHVVRLETKFFKILLAIKLNKENNEAQINSFMYALGQEADHVMKTFTNAEGEDQTKFDVVYAKFLMDILNSLWQSSTKEPSSILANNIQTNRLNSSLGHCMISQKVSTIKRIA